jgi:thiamine-monophosphate kinase
VSLCLCGENSFFKGSNLKKRKAHHPTIGQIGEFGFIGKIRKRLKAAGPFVKLGIGDDAAILKPSPGRELVFTTDMLVEGRHFDFKFTTPWQLGAKAMAVNISDCAAMGAAPMAAVVSVGVPGNFPVAKLEAFLEGLKEWAESYGVQIVGGDTVAGNEFVVNVALVGEVEEGRALRRSGARPGDAIFMTGTLGDSAAGLHALLHPSKKNRELAPLLILKHLLPVPRFNVGRQLATQRLASSAIDISDGLSSEINHLCEESATGAEINEESLPLSASLMHYCRANRLDPLRFALDGGEDYELLFTVPSSKVSSVWRKLSVETGVAIRYIGRVLPRAKGVTFIRRRGGRVPLKAKGFDHFSS